MREFSVMRLAALAALGAAMLVLGGCATPARVEQMQVSSDLAKRTSASKAALREQVALRDVSGGRETNPMWMSSVSSGDFERALEASLRDVGLLASNRQASKYFLLAHLQKLDQPLGGFNMTVTATVRYELVERSSNKTVLERSLATPYTAALGDALLGTERLKLANEGAMRANIQQLIDQLLSFDPAAGAVSMSR